MRIIAGTARGRRLFSPVGGIRNQLIRPTSDRAREALFSIIGSQVQGAVVLDLFAGTGALGLEALSRGAASVVFVDNNRNALALINKNSESCGFSGMSRIVKRDISKSLSFLKKYAPGHGFSLIFLDPPYGKGLCEKVLVGLGKSELIGHNGMVVAEDTPSAKMPAAAGLLSLKDFRNYGDTGFWFYRNKEMVDI